MITGHRRKMTSPNSFSFSELSIRYFNLRHQATYDALAISECQETVGEESHRRGWWRSSQLRYCSWSWLKNEPSETALRAGADQYRRTGQIWRASVKFQSACMLFQFRTFTSQLHFPRRNCPWRVWSLQSRIFPSLIWDIRKKYGSKLLFTEAGKSLSSSRWLSP